MPTLGEALARLDRATSTAEIRALAKTIGRDHSLADQLWQTAGWRARALAVFIDDPKLVTARQMDTWARGFTGWADCDAACFHLFDKTPLAWKKIERWSTRKEELVKRGAFAMLAAVALHDKEAPDEPFRRSMKLIERASSDDRHFVKMGVSWALRQIGKRNARLRTVAMKTATKLSKSDIASARWIGKDAIRDLSR